MKTKEEIIAVIDSTNHLGCEDCVAIKHHLTQPTLNPMKIDEERMRECFEQVFTKDIYLKSHFKTIVDQYNSTCEDHQVLQPLPSDIPAKIGRMIYEYARDNNMSIDDIWKEIFDHYGTPTQKELPSVEELDEEICALHRVIMPATSKLIAQHIIDTYSLNPPKREWWMDLKDDDSLIYKGNVKTFASLDKRARITLKEGGWVYADDCTPYIEPTTIDICKEKLGTELFEKLMKEVKG
jgi:hypothetical protein